MKASLPTIEKQCAKHGITTHAKRTNRDTGWFCRKCASERVARFRTNLKLKLVEEFGGKCVNCGYNKYIGALHFHHRDPKEKKFGIAHKGFTRPYEEVLKEARKCDLLCANCHAEMEGNFDL